GGSVNETNGAEIFSLGSVSGALVGGASLDAEKFASLCTISQQK
ncbi:MAG: triose-phosphate isomerase, partial [Candidatus Puniceispirillaceae bacterium]